MQNYSNSIANALELLQSYNKPSIYAGPCFIMVTLTLQPTSQENRLLGFIKGLGLFHKHWDNPFNTTGPAPTKRFHDDVTKWKHFPRYWPFVRAIHRQMRRSFGVFFGLRLNNRLSKQSKRRWFEAPSRSFYRHCNVWRILLMYRSLFIETLIIQ